MSKITYFGFVITSTISMSEVKALDTVVPLPSMNVNQGTSPRLFIAQSHTLIVSIESVDIFDGSDRDEVYVDYFTCDPVQGANCNGLAGAEIDQLIVNGKKSWDGEPFFRRSTCWLYHSVGPQKWYKLDVEEGGFRIRLAPCTMFGTVGPGQLALVQSGTSTCLKIPDFLATFTKLMAIQK